MSPSRLRLGFPGIILLAAAPLAGAEFGPPAPIPPPSSPFLGFVYRYGDAMLKSGRDAQGPVKGVEGWTENLLRVLYTLSDLSSRPDYRDAADQALQQFLQRAPSRILSDRPGPRGEEGDPGRPVFDRPWVLWDRCFQIAPEPSRRFVLGLWKGETADGPDDPRHAGFFIRTWAAAHHRTKDEALLRAIEALLARFEKKRHPVTGLIESAPGRTDASPAGSLSLAIDCDAAGRLVPEPLGTRLRAFAAREDQAFLALGHELSGGGGFAVTVNRETGKPSGDFTPPWDAAAGRGTTARVALLCVSRYENTGRTGYRELIDAAARAYLDSAPPAELDVWPGALGHAISLQLAAWRGTSREVHLDRARKLGELAVAAFWPGPNPGPFPRASSRSAGSHDAATGADSLALALVELHLAILHITAVRPPSPSIDR